MNTLDKFLILPFGQFFWLFLFFNWGIVQSYAFRTDVEMAKGSPVDIRIESAFQNGPRAGGHLPVRVTIQNYMERAGSWAVNIETSHSSYNSVTFVTKATFTVPAEQQQVFELSLPLPNYSRKGYSDIHVTGNFSGEYTHPQLSTFWQSLNTSGYGYNGEHFFLLSPALYRAHGSRLNSIFEKKGGNSIITEYDPKQLIGDWRTFVGFDVFIVALQDWRSLRSEVRYSVMKAVESGYLDLRFHVREVTESVSKELGFVWGQNIRRYGLGMIAYYSEEMDAAISRLEMNSDGDSGIFQNSFLNSTEEGDWPMISGGHAVTSAEGELLEDLMNAKSIPVGILSLLMLVFGILIGPVNFLALAKGRRRLKLFVTTPIIAGIASGLLFLGIFLFDGFGGKGYIARLVLIDGDERKIYVEQEQYADTGLYFSQPFEFVGVDWIVPRGASVRSLKKLEVDGDFVKEGEKHSGNWFASKRIQGLSARTFISSRERFELLSPSSGSDAPVVYSNFRGISDTFFFVDTKHQLWKGERLRLGAEQALKKVEKSEFQRWMASEIKRAGKHLGPKIQDIGIRPGFFYTSVTDWEQKGLETVGNLDWEVHSQLVIGRLTSVSVEGRVQ